MSVAFYLWLLHTSSCLFMSSLLCEQPRIGVLAGANLRSRCKQQLVWMAVREAVVWTPGRIHSKCSVNQGLELKSKRAFYPKVHKHEPFSKVVKIVNT